MDVRRLIDRLGPTASPERATELLDHPDTEEAHLLGVLRKRDLPSAFLEALARHERWNGRHVIRAAIVNHPKTPKTLALRLLNQLFWKELLKVANNFRLPMPIRAAAEKYLRNRLAELELGERITMARTATAIRARRITLFPSVVCRHVKSARRVGLPVLRCGASARAAGER